MARRCRKIEELSTADLAFSLDELRGRSLEELSRPGATAARWVSVRVKQGAPVLALRCSPCAGQIWG